MRRCIGAAIVAVSALLVATGGADAAEPGVPGERLVYIDRDDGTVVLADADGGDPTVVRTDPAISDLAPSPDGERIAMIRSGSPGRAGTPQYVDTMRDDGSCGQRVAASFIGDVAWDNQAGEIRLAYSSYPPDLEPGLWIERDGPFPRRVRIRSGGAGDLSIHPRGEVVAFSSNGDISVVASDGSSTSDVPLVWGPTVDRAPAYDHDGGRIVFLRAEGGRDVPYVASSDGTGQRRVADVDLRDVQWGDAGSLIASKALDSDDPGIVRIDVATGAVTQLTHGQHTSAHVSARGGRAGADGYTLTAADGAAFSFGAACPPQGPQDLADAPFVASAATPDRATIWYVDAEGHIGHQGAARTFGEITTPLAQPIVGMAGTPSGNGYWLVARDGGIFSFGDATFLGSTGAMRLNQPIVGMASTPSGKGYWLVASDGGIFSFGDARFAGSTGAMKLNAPIFTMAPTATGRGYWLFAADGGVFTFGDAVFRGSTGAMRLNAPVIAVTPTATGAGYWLIGGDGGVFSFGDARFVGSTGDVRLAAPVIGALTR